MLVIVIQIPRLEIGVFVFIQCRCKVSPIELREGLQRAQDARQCSECNDKGSDIVLRLKVSCIVRCRHDRPQFAHLLVILCDIEVIGLKQIRIRVSVARIGLQSIVQRLLDITVSDYLTKLLRHLVHTVCTAVCLNQKVPDKILIKEQRVRRLAVKTCQEHIHNQKQVNLRQVFLLHTLGNILAVGIKLTEVVHAGSQMFASVLIWAFFHVLIGLISEDSCNLISLRVMHLHIVVILHQRLNLIDGKNGCINIVVFQSCMLVQVFKDISQNGSNTLIGMIQFVKVYLVTLAVFRIVQRFRVNLRVLDARDRNTSHVFDREPKHITVSNGFLNHVLMNARVKLP